MGSQIQQVLDYVDNEAKDDFQKLAEKYWPGPLTLIIPISKNKSLDFIPRENTLGIRIPDSSSARSLILETGPLATSSANISGLDTSFDPEAISNDLPGVDLLGPIPWEECSGLGSTIISWSKGGKWRLIREGQLPISKII
tara:strand:- start:146 stop:568 length:423 start_codon:yes stop_codon:yes gene_type:complete